MQPKVNSRPPLTRKRTSRIRVDPQWTVRTTLEPSDTRDWAESRETEQFHKYVSDLKTQARRRPRTAPRAGL